MKTIVKNIPTEIIKGWHFIDDKENLYNMPTNRDFEVLFDDGFVCKFSDEDFPFAEIIAWRELIK